MGEWSSDHPNSQGRMDALAIDAPVEYVRLMLSGDITLAEEKETWKPKERRRTTMSRDFLRKLLIKLNIDKKRGI